MTAVNPYQRVQDAPDWNQPTFANGDVPKWDSASGKFISGGNSGSVTGKNHADVRAATVAAGTLATSFANGQTIDGVILSTGDRVLIKDQASGVENGLYVVAASGAPARASDLPAAASASFIFVFVREGTVNADKGFLCTSLPGSDVAGTNNLTWAQFTGGAGTLHSTLSGLSADDHTQYLLVAGSRAFTGDQSLGSHKLTNLATPTATTDAANKQYVDGVAAGLKVHPTCRVATTAAGTLATSFANGQTIDGVILSTGDRILIKDQASGVENGLYVVAASGAPARASDLAAASAAAAVFVFITSGTTNIGTGWVCTTASGSDVVGTNALTFTQFSGFGSGGGGGSTLTVLESRARPFRNYLVNGSFGQFQRRSGASAIICNNSVYGPDAWYNLFDNISGNITVLQLSGSGTRSKTSAQWTQQSGGASQHMGMAQVIEASDTLPLRSRSVTLQGRVKFGGTGAIQFAILEWQGSADLVTRDVVNNWGNTTYTTGNFFKSTNMAVVAVGSITPSVGVWTDFSLTGTPSALVNNLIVMIWPASAQTVGITVEYEAVGLFDGPTTRDWLPEPESLNLRRCERFLRVVEAASGLVSGFTTAYLTVPHSGMFATPSGSQTGAVQLYVGGTSLTIATQSGVGISAINADKDGSVWQLNNFASLPVGAPVLLSPGSSSARILLDASL